MYMYEYNFTTGNVRKTSGNGINGMKQINIEYICLYQDSDYMVITRYTNTSSYVWCRDDPALVTIPDRVLNYLIIANLK